MKILIDIGHPAHVHYFKNFIKIMKNNGHEFLITARNRPLIHYLLTSYNLVFFDRGKGKDSVFGKFFYMLYADWKLLKLSFWFKPDLFISFASPYASQVSWIRGKPNIVLDDTEHARVGQFFYKPFAQTFLNPACFKKDLGSKQIKFDSFTELFYLHPKYYIPDNSVFRLLHLNCIDKYVLLRFVSFKANHDFGHSGLDLVSKKKLVNVILENGYKVFISNESNDIDSFFKPYLITIPPEKMHDVIHYSELLIAESGTMASEAAILGTPVIYVNSLPLMGYLEEQQRAGLLFHFRSSKGVIEKTKELFSLADFKKTFESHKQKMLVDKIDVSAFLVWFIENYPESAMTMNKNPEYQNRFKQFQEMN